MIWRSPAPEKVRFFLWLIGREALPTNARRFQCHLTPEPKCSRCNIVDEDLHHLFRECPSSRLVWAFFHPLVPNSAAAIPFKEWFYGLLLNQNAHLVISILWWLWKWRNHVIFEANDWSEAYILRSIMISAQEFRRFGSASLEVPRAISSVMEAYIRTDGSWSNNRMGGGGFLRDSIGRWI
jgi:hypothetical protein